MRIDDAMGIRLGPESIGNPRILRLGSDPPPGLVTFWPLDMEKSPKKKKSRSTLTAIQKAEVAGRRLFRNEKNKDLAAEFDIHRDTVTDIVRAHSTPGSDLHTRALQAAEQYHMSKSTFALPVFFTNTTPWNQVQQMGVAAAVQSRDLNFHAAGLTTMPCATAIVRCPPVSVNIVNAGVQPPVCNAPTGSSCPQSGVGNTEDNPPAATMSTISVSTHNLDPPLQNPILEAVSISVNPAGPGDSFRRISKIDFQLTPRLKQRILDRADFDHFVEKFNSESFFEKLKKAGISSLEFMEFFTMEDTEMLGLSNEEFDMIKMDDVDWTGKAWIKEVLTKALPFKGSSQSQFLICAEEGMKRHKIYNRPLLEEYCKRDDLVPVLRAALTKYLQRDEITQNSSHGIFNIHSSIAAASFQSNGARQSHDVEVRPQEVQV